MELGVQKMKLRLTAEYGINISEGRVYRLMKSMQLPKMSNRSHWRYICDWACFEGMENKKKSQVSNFSFRQGKPIYFEIISPVAWWNRFPSIAFSTWLSLWQCGCWIFLQVSQERRDIVKTLEKESPLAKAAFPWL